MYVITAPVKAGNPSTSRGRAPPDAGLRALGHPAARPRRAPPDHRRSAGHTAPFYAEPVVHAQRGLRAFAAYFAARRDRHLRVKDDFKAQGPRSDTFAVPFGDHGQRSSKAHGWSSSSTSCSPPSSARLRPGRRQRAALHAADRSGVPLRAVHGDDDRRAARLARAPRPGDPRHEGGAGSAPADRPRARAAARGPAQPAWSRSQTKPRKAKTTCRGRSRARSPSTAACAPRRGAALEAAAVRRGANEGAGGHLPRLPRRARRRPDTPPLDEDQRAHRAHLPAHDRRRHGPREVHPLPRAADRPGPLVPCAFDAADGDRRRHRRREHDDHLGAVTAGRQPDRRLPRAARRRRLQADVVDRGAGAAARTGRRASRSRRSTGAA